MYGRKGFAPQPPDATGPYDQYQASDIYNDSGVTGDNVKEALDALNSGIAGAVFVEEQITLTATQASNKAILLQNTPKQDLDIEFTIVGSSTNVRDIHFYVTGSVLNWSGTSLDGILSEGDIVSIKYYK